MDDKAILELYRTRSDRAIKETASKYGAYCYRIAYNILSCREDSQECVNDTYLAAWNTIPPKAPAILSTYLGKLTRYISLDRWKRRNAYKRGGGEVTLALEELGECITDGNTPEKTYEQKELAVFFNRFLQTLSETERRVFLCRYWYLEPTGSIAKCCGFSETKVRSMLHRIRKRLRTAMEKEGLQ